MGTKKWGTFNLGRCQNNYQKTKIKITRGNRRQTSNWRIDYFSRKLWIIPTIYFMFNGKTRKCVAINTSSKMKNNEQIQIIRITKQGVGQKANPFLRELHKSLALCLGKLSISQSCITYEWLLIESFGKTLDKHVALFSHN